MWAKGFEGSVPFVRSVQKHASLHDQRPPFPSRMMCSHESSVRPWPAVRIGRIARGGATGGLLSGRGGGVS